MADAFVGHEYVEEKCDNLSEYMTAKGIPMFVRLLISGKMKNGYFNLVTVNEETYKITLGTPRGRKEYTFKFDEPVTAEGYDGKQHKITFSIENGKLKEKHEHLEGDRKGENDDITLWQFDNGTLISETPAKKSNGEEVIWKRYFKKL
ncbi:hypothetical protein AB6A40_007249 [Gnathostoma spinigerum]|uniref:Lipocalin/cytosolic fatty-acid binding domain-containing protein n=1 Tax=Gnathostoma spinigerum TaxID=75299 RepID=A0ABD6EKN7_9BILA